MTRLVAALSVAAVCAVPVATQEATVVFIVPAAGDWKVGRPSSLGAILPTW